MKILVGATIARKIDSFKAREKNAIWSAMCESVPYEKRSDLREEYKDKCESVDAKWYTDKVCGMYCNSYEALVVTEEQEAECMKYFSKDPDEWDIHEVEYTEETLKEITVRLAEEDLKKKPFDFAVMYNDLMNQKINY